VQVLDHKNLKMNNPEPLIPSLIRDFKNKDIIKKKKEIEKLKLDIEKQKLQNELNNLMKKK